MYKRILFLFLSCFLAFSAFTQDSSAFAWTVKSERISAGEYRLSFQTPVNNNWQLYAPSQDIAGIQSSALLFKDSSISLVSPLTGQGDYKTIKSALFDNQPFKIYEGSATWTATVKIPGEVPASLLGTLQYTYGKGDEFYPTESKEFEVALEGGVVVNNRIRIETVDLSAPVLQCGIEKEEKKGSLWKIFFLGFLGGLVGPGQWPAARPASALRRRTGRCPAHAGSSAAPGASRASGPRARGTTTGGHPPR